MNLGLLVIRAAVGMLLVGHGSQKLFGRFGGHGLEGTGASFEAMGLRPGGGWRCSRASRSWSAGAFWPPAS